MSKTATGVNMPKTATGVKMSKTAIDLTKMHSFGAYKGAEKIKRKMIILLLFKKTKKLYLIKLKLFDF